MNKIPKLKKKITSFLTKEDGKISKENIVKVGVLITAFSVGAAMGPKPVSSEVACSNDCTDISNPEDCISCDINHVDHSNSLSLSYNSPNAAATHNHCVQSCHSNHSSHSSHGHSW